VGKHSSVAEISADQQKSIPLESCINLFTQQEKLSATDTWYVLPRSLSSPSPRPPLSA
jgi:ubiquitin C-terminal hydrolase